MSEHELDNVIADLEPIISEAKEAETENIINSPNAGRKAGKKKAALVNDDNGVFSSQPKTATPKKAAKPKASKPKNETVAIYSERNVVWRDVGKISKGYNIVSSEAAKKWLTRSYIREATPEEVAREFGV